jgi:hypothetical protein
MKQNVYTVGIDLAKKIFHLRDPVADGQKTALRPLAVYRRKGLPSSTGLRPSLCLKMRVLARTQLFPGASNVAPW